MESWEDALLAFGIVGGAGLLFVVVGILIFVLERKKKRNCTCHTIGRIVGYRGGNGVLCPVVEYFVNGSVYRCVRRFRAVVTVSVPGIRPGDDEMYVSSNDVVHIRRGKVFYAGQAARRQYPKGASMDVWYNPQKPRQAYAEKIPEKLSAMGLVFFWTGIGMFLLGIGLAVLIYMTGGSR